MGSLEKNNLPDQASSDVISENLAGFFLNKILKIRDQFCSSMVYTHMNNHQSAFSNGIFQGSNWNVCAKGSHRPTGKNHVNKIRYQPILSSPELTPSLKPYTKLVNLSLIYSPI